MPQVRCQTPILQVDDYPDYYGLGDLAQDIFVLGRQFDLAHERIILEDGERYITILVKRADDVPALPLSVPEKYFERLPKLLLEEFVNNLDKGAVK